MQVYSYTKIFCITDNQKSTMGLYMPMNALWMYLILMFPNSTILLVFVFTLSTILAWAFLHKYLNPFINATLAIIGCALESILTFIMLPISWTAKKIETHIVQPIENLKKRIHIPVMVRIVFYTLFGIWVFYLDHIHNIRVFNDNETFIMLPVVIYGIKFWISATALAVGGSSLGISIILIAGEILKALDRLLDRTVNLNIIVYR